LSGTDQRQAESELNTRRFVPLDGVEVIAVEIPRHYSVSLSILRGGMTPDDIVDEVLSAWHECPGGFYVDEATWRRSEGADVIAGANIGGACLAARGARLCRGRCRQDGSREQAIRASANGRGWRMMVSADYSAERQPAGNAGQWHARREWCRIGGQSARGGMAEWSMAVVLKTENADLQNS
jgi:hypothetical protein